MAIALDAMGGDLAPAATVEGALRAHRERGLDIVLVGDEERLRFELRRLRIERANFHDSTALPIASIKSASR